MRDANREHEWEAQACSDERKVDYRKALREIIATAESKSIDERRQYLHDQVVSWSHDVDYLNEVDIEPPLAYPVSYAVNARDENPEYQRFIERLREYADELSEDDGTRRDIAPIHWKGEDRQLIALFDLLHHAGLIEVTHKNRTRPFLESGQRAWKPIVDHFDNDGSPWGRSHLSSVKADRYNEIGDPKDFIDLLRRQLDEKSG